MNKELAPPPPGTAFAYPGGEAIFAKYSHKPDGSLTIDCSSCVYREPCGHRPAGTPTIRPCIGGVYLDKMKYLEMKLLGEIT